MNNVQHKSNRRDRRSPRRARWIARPAASPSAPPNPRSRLTTSRTNQRPTPFRYTAGAVASIAHDTPAPIVDGNVARVFARLVPITDPIDKPDAQRRLWSLATHYASGPRPGDANQALMELGATVCTPRTPHCLTCPLRHHCQGVRTTNPESLPVKSPRRQPTAVTHDVLAVRDADDRYLFTRRPDTGLWSSMWQLPTHEGAPATPTWLCT
ncbi:MAG: hypothetical protein AAF078_09290, partial [Planctomycetota bacterium]